jgi:hypothetical protein
MKNWSGILKKTLVVGLSVLSFGIITPSQYQEWYEGTSAKDEKAKPYSLTEAAQIYEEAETTADSQAEFLSFMMSQAESQSIEKFGPRIAPVIEEEFYSAVLPGMQAALEQFSAEYPNERLSDISISEKPSGGLGEKIFHLYDNETRKDLIRFHVRRENPPGEGHWFEFHYHTYKDHFTAHHSIARIYWSQNTPPKWLS